MMKRTKRLIAIICAVAVAVTSMAVSVSTVFAVSNPETLDGASYKIANIWADPENVLTQEKAAAFAGGSTTAIPGAVGFHKIQSSGNYYLFLPSDADCNSLKFWFITNETVKLNNITLVSGEPTDALAAIDEGGVSHNYTLIIGSNSYSITAMKSGGVGAVYIDTQSGSISSINSNKENVESGTILVVSPDGTVDYDGVLEKMHGRGNASWGYSTKKPYSIKLAESTSLLGMSKSKKWALTANHSSLDASLLRNQITYDFSDYIGVKYQVHCKPVDLYVNQQYFGSYQLTEKPQLKSTRINVSDAYESLELANPGVDVDNAEANSVSQSNSSTIGQREYSASLNDPDDVTGGYLYELEISRRWVEDAAGFCAYNKQGWNIKSCDRVSTGMSDYSYDLLFALGSSVYNNGVVPSTATSRKYGSGLFSTTVNNPAPAEEYWGKSWDELLDKKSAVIYYWTQEYFMNLDSSTTSCYFYKDSDSVDSKLYAGPVWDMDNSWCYDKSGSRWGHSYTSAEDWYAKNCAIYRWNQSDALTSYTADSRVPRTFYGALCYNCEGFWETAENYWYSKIEPATQILLGNAEDDTGKLHSVAWYTQNIEKSGKMNSVRHGVSEYNAATVTTNMNAWLTKRNNWINNQISQYSIDNAAIGIIPQQQFTGSEITPEVEISYNNSPLEEGSDYELTYNNNVEVGLATVTVTGCGRYTGSVDTTFVIVKGDVPTLSIDEQAYAGDTLYTDIPEALTPYLSFQWKADGENISGATDSTYTVLEADRGKNISVAVTGDGVNLNATTELSGSCEILDGVRPGSYTATIASWNYDYTADPTPIDTQNLTGVYSYTATGGEQAATASLYASTDSVNTAEIEWSDVGDEFKQSVGTLAKDRVPVMEPSSSTGVAWGEYPYFETSVTTVGYKDITFSARVGATKKGPSSWKVQYSLDGTTFTDIDGAAYTLAANKTVEAAFTDISLPSPCNNYGRIYIRIISSSSATVAGGNYLTADTMYSGSAAVNNIEIKGTTMSAITSLDAPEITTSSGTALIYETDTVSLSSSSSSANLYYSVNGGDAVLYEGAFNPFALTAHRGDTAVITAYAQFDIVVSETAEYTVTYGGGDLAEFSYSKYPDNETNGTVYSTGGVYGKSSKMTANADGTSQYPPLWNDSNKAFTVSPDDGLKWTEESGFTFEFTTAGYTNIAFACKAYTTAQGPKSASLQYSLDGENWNGVSGYQNVALPAQLTDYLVCAALPSDCGNRSSVFVRLVTEENLTNGGSTLHNNESKGNFYINDIVISGEANGAYRMPYTEKTSDYFGNGEISYASPDGLPVKYSVTDFSGSVISSGSFSTEGIAIASLSGFNAAVAGPYTVYAWCGDADDKSVINVREYYYKGETVAAFKYNDSSRPFASYYDANEFFAYNTSGAAQSGKLSMYPDASSAAELSYTGTYGVKVSKPSDGAFSATENLDDPRNNGYWLIETSTEGFRDLTLTLEQLSSNKGPRDWGIAYSTNGITYTYVENSNARAISNDAYGKTVESYNNLRLPEACSDKNKLYIKVFINGGETLDGTELDDPTLTKGNIGMNNIELKGIPVTNEFELSVNTVLMETPDGGYGDYPIDASVKVDGETVAGDGSETVTVNAGDTVTVVSNSGRTFEKKFTFVANANKTNITVPVVDVDMNQDGIINAKDYAYILKLNDNAKKAKYASVFEEFINETE